MKNLQNKLCTKRLLVNFKSSLSDDYLQMYKTLQLFTNTFTYITNTFTRIKVIKSTSVQTQSY